MLKEYSINIWYVIDIITMYIDWIIFFTVLNLVGERRISKKKYISRVIMLVLFMGFLNISNMFENTKIILCMIIGVIFYKLSYKDNIYKCIMINLLFWLGLIINESVSISIVVMLNRLESIQLLLAGNIFRMQAIFISKILLTLELILFKYFRLSLEFKLKDMILIGIPINIISFNLNSNDNLKYLNNISSRVNSILDINIACILNIFPANNS